MNKVVREAIDSRKSNNNTRRTWKSVNDILEEMKWCLVDKHTQAHTITTVVASFLLQCATDYLHTRQRERGREKIEVMVKL